MRFSSFRRARFPLVLLALVAVLLVGLPPASAQLDQIPGPHSPAAKDQVQIYRDEPGTIAGRTEFPDPKLAVFVQPEGREWRTFRVVALRVIAGIYKERVQRRGYGSGAWGWRTAYRQELSA